MPHIGWNSVRFEGDHPDAGRAPRPRTSSTSCTPTGSSRADPGQVVGVTDYGGPFAAAVADEGIFAVQFHPEKSQNAGRRLLDAYAGWVASC